MARTNTQAPRSAATDENATPPANKPIARFQCGSSSASVFINQVKTKNDETVSIPSVTLQRVYTDRNGNRAYTHSLRRDDILPAAYALCEAYGFISRGGVEEAEDEA